MADVPEAVAVAEPAGVSWADFLATSPPDVVAKITDLGTQKFSPGTHSYYWDICAPDLRLYCLVCEGERSFENVDQYPVHLASEEWVSRFLRYRCKNCERQTKIYALAAKQTELSAYGSALKLGEMPAFGPHTPARVISLIGRDRELFLKGRRAENRSLGIGAFSYYRRVVENQKSRIIEQIAKVAAKLGAKPEILKEFKAAAAETQFSKAIDQIKHGIPESLLIDGHNPLTLLHSSLSDGMHDRSDDECLEIAHEIRLVLTELAERLSGALKQDAELTDAVSKLLARKSEKPTV